jgi:hypothetical protein
METIYEVKVDRELQVRREVHMQLENRRLQEEMIAKARQDRLLQQLEVDERRRAERRERQDQERMDDQKRESRQIVKMRQQQMR